MARRRLQLITVAVAALAALLVSFGFTSRRADNPVLTGTTGANDAFTITLADASGAPVKHLDPGTYTLSVHDLSALHNFHLLGPGVDVTTQVPTTGDSSFTVTLTDGTYTFQCDPHAAAGMKGTFTVGTPPAAPPPPPAPVKLGAHVGAGSIGVTGAISLNAGKAVLTVNDRSATDNFHLTGPGVNKSTGVGFRGTVRWTVTLSAGTYRFHSDRHPKLKGSFTVAASNTTSAAATGPGAGGDYGLGGY